MSKSKLKLLTVFFSFLAMSAYVNADTLSESGSRVIVCVTAGHIDQVSLYDFVEGREKNHLEIKDEGLSKDQYIQRVLDKLKRRHPYFQSMLKEELDFITSESVYVQSNTILSLSKDNLDESSFRICDNNLDVTKLQVATFKSKENKLLVDQKLLKYLSPLDQAGLLVSTAIYRVLRNYVHLNNNKIATELTARLFTDVEIVDSVFMLKTFDQIFSQAFQLYIVDFENNVLAKWVSYKTQAEADQYLASAETLLPFNIKYHTTITANALPPLQIVKLQKTLLKDGDYQPAIDLAIGSGWTFLGALGIAFMGAMDGGIPVLTSIAITGIALSGAGIVAATTVASVIAVKVAVKKVQLKRVKDLLLEAYACDISATDCQEETFVHLRSTYDHFIQGNPQHDNISLKQYVNQVMKLTRESKLMDMKRKDMVKVIDSSFEN